MKTFKHFFATLILSLIALNASAIRSVESVLVSISGGDFVEAKKQIEKLVANGNVDAYFYLGQMYEKGIIYEQDSNQAFANYRKAAERGYAPAQHALGYCYKYGIGTAINDNRATYWITKARDKFDTAVLTELETNYKIGVETRKMIANNPDMPTLPEGVKVIEHKDGSKSTVVITDIQTGEIQKSDVDLNIPAVDSENRNNFALIFANENYQEIANVDYAINDGEVFAQYLINTLGYPKDQVKVVKNATLNNFTRSIGWLQRLSAKRNGKINVVVYYAGHGYPDEKDKTAMIVPVDGYPNDKATCLPLSQFYKKLSAIKMNQCVCFIDACFSGSTRGTQMIYAERGIAIKPKVEKDALPGNFIVFSATKEDQKALPYHDMQHGIFTYYLLKELQQSNGNVTLGELQQHLSENVSETAIRSHDKEQTPEVIVNKKSGEWKNLRLSF